MSAQFVEEAEIERLSAKNVHQKLESEQSKLSEQSNVTLKLEEDRIKLALELKLGDIVIVSRARFGVCCV